MIGPPMVSIWLITAKRCFAPVERATAYDIVSVDMTIDDIVVRLQCS